MKSSVWFLGLGIVLACLSGAGADGGTPSRFKSPSGRFEMFFEPLTEDTTSHFFGRPHIPSGQTAQYVLYFYASGSSEAVSTDYYIDADPPKPPAEILSSMLWSPQEDYVVVTHGRHSKGPGTLRWVVSMHGPDQYGFEAGRLEWIDPARLAGDVNTSKSRGAFS